MLTIKGPLQYAGFHNLSERGSSRGRFLRNLHFFDSRGLDSSVAIWATTHSSSFSSCTTRRTSASSASASSASKSWWRRPPSARSFRCRRDPTRRTTFRGLWPARWVAAHAARRSSQPRTRRAQSRWGVFCLCFGGGDCGRGILVLGREAPP